jgi:hypothetical protein
LFTRPCVETETCALCVCLVQEAACRQRPELCVTVGYMKLCVDRDLNCGRKLVT